jgi:hypothetical protein
MDAGIVVPNGGSSLVFLENGQRLALVSSRRTITVQEITALSRAEALRFLKDAVPILLAIQEPRRRSRNPRSSRLRNPGQLRRAERYRQTPPLKGAKIGSR